MDINFTLWSTSPSGGYKVIFELANGLVERGHQVTITALGGDHSWFPLKAEVNYIKPPWPIKLLSPLLRIILKRPARYYEILTLTQKMKMGFEPDLVKALADNTPKCDVNIATWFPTASAVYRSGKGVPVNLCQDFDQLAKERGPYFNRMFKESLYLPLNLITISGWLKDWLKEEYDKDSEIIPIGIDHDIFYPRENEKDDGYLKIMGIFRGLYYKGDNDLIEALKIVAEEYENLKLVAVGKKEVLDDLLNEKDLNFEIESYNWLTDDEMALLYSSSDIFAFPSHIEGFGLPPLEAMACKTPVVTTDCLGVRDYILPNENAIIIPPKDPENLAKSIIDLAGNESLKEKFKKNGLIAAREYNWDNAVDVFEKALIKYVKEDNK